MISEEKTVSLNGKEAKTEKKKRPPRALPSLAAAAGASDMANVVYNCKVDTTPISWDNLPIYSLFSRSADGSFPLFKISKSQYADLRTGKSEWCGSGRCYKVVM